MEGRDVLIDLGDPDGSTAGEAGTIAATVTGDEVKVEAERWGTSGQCWVLTIASGRGLKHRSPVTRSLP